MNNQSHVNNNFELGNIQQDSPSAPEFEVSQQNHIQPNPQIHPQYSQQYNNNNNNFTAIPYIPQAFAPQMQVIQQRIPLPVETQTKITSFFTGELVIPKEKNDQEKNKYRVCMMMWYSVVLSLVFAFAAVGCVVGALFFKLDPTLEEQRDAFWYFVVGGSSALCIFVASMTGFLSSFFAFVKLYCLAITFTSLTMLLYIIAFLIIFVPLFAFFVAGIVMCFTIILAICGIPIIIITVFGMLIGGTFTCPCICCNISNLKYYFSVLKENKRKESNKKNEITNVTVIQQQPNMY